MEITALSTYDLKTCKAIQRFTMFGKNNPFRRLLFWGIIYIIILFAVLSLLVADITDVFSWILFILIIVVIVFFGVYYFYTPRARYKSLGRLADTQMYFRFRKTEFSVISDVDGHSESTTLKYDMIRKVAETSKYFFVYPANGSLYTIDKSTIQNGNAELLKALLVSGPSVKYIKCRY